MDESKSDPESIQNQGHAYHYNLPPHYTDEDGIPRVIKYANAKAKAIVEIAFSIQLSPDLFVDGDDDAGNAGNEEKPTLVKLIQKCNLLSSQLTSLRELKHGGISQLNLCHIATHLLRLLTATVVIERETNHAEIHYDNVGYLYDTTQKRKVRNDAVPYGDRDDDLDGGTDVEGLDLESYLAQPFALPTPARESLLSVVISLLTTDELLRAVSNTSFRTPDENFNEEYNGELLLVIHWKAMLRMLLRTSPYLDERKTGGVQLDSLSRQSTVLKRTVLVIRYLRRFYNQGLEVKDNILTDQTANEVWEMVHPDLLYQTHTNACYRAIIMMYLFQPSRCSKEFYLKVVPKWLESWTSIDRCPDFDFLWLTMFCRARKYLGPDDYDWGTIRKRLLTLCGYWLQIPVGGQSIDKLFPAPAKAKSRSIPARLKAFVGNPSSYQEGVDFVSKLSKLLMFCLGKNDIRGEAEMVIDADSENGHQGVSDGTVDMLQFLSFVSPYFHPSNTGAWTFSLGVLLHYLSYEFCRRVARRASQKAIMKKYPLLAKRVGEIEPYKEGSSSVLPDKEIVLILDALLPLCQQTLYSKSSQVARAGESALLYLTQIDHKICPMFLDFAMRALDISSVTLSHQAPAALSALSRLVSPSLKNNPSFFLERLPEILRLTLAGIDSNDHNKTIRTLIFYRTVASWIPIGEATPANTASLSSHKSGSWEFGKELPDAVREVSDSKEYWAALRNLPKSSLLYQAETSYEMEQEEERLAYLAEEASFALGDWSLSFLERIYDILRAAGEQEKVGKSRGIASRHSSADASDAKHFTMLLKQCVSQVFAAMDDKNFALAANSVQSFIQNESLPLAVKYASILCEAVGAARHSSNETTHSPGLDILLPLLVRDLPSKSKSTILYRVRCLAGAIRLSGSSALKHRQEIFSVLQFTLYEQVDKKIFKAGCKILRHLLSSQCESYPVASDSCARLSDNHPLGKPPHLSKDHIRWHVPSGEQIDFCAQIIKQFCFKSITNLSLASNDSDTITGQTFDVIKFRNSLKILEYTLRGAAGILPEPDQFHKEAMDCISNYSDPNEISACALLQSAPLKTQRFLYSSRLIVSKFCVSLLSVIACGSELALENDSVDTEGTGKRTVENIIASDAKICKLSLSIAALLSIRRGATTHCQDTKATWKLQKGLATDRVLSTTRDEISTILRKAGRGNPPEYCLYNDGDEGGKSLPRRMVINGVYIFLQMIQRHSSFQIPRRLRKRNEAEEAGKKAFVFETRFASLDKLISSHFSLEINTDLEPFSEDSLRFYEGMIDGGFALSCHTNAHIRTNGSRLVENLFSRFGWFARERVGRLISCLALDDEGRKGQNGLLSSADLSSSESTSSRKRLSEVLKGVSTLLHLSKINKEIIQSEQHRLLLIKTICKSQQVISLLPPEEIKKMTHYYHGIYSKYRSRHFSLQRVDHQDIALRKQYLQFLLNQLRDDAINAVESDEIKSAHWRDRLSSLWFLFTLIDDGDIFDVNLLNAVWDTCFICLRETGQPIQKLSLGFIGRMCSLSLTNNHALKLKSLENRLHEKDFCVEFCTALVFNHKEDNSVGGGHKAQWSIGVSSMLRDAHSQIAPRSIFPFKRMGRSSGTLMISHAQLIHSLLVIVDKKCAKISAKHFLSYAEELASSPPSEDQRNQILTSAEIFCGISHALAEMGDSPNDIVETWNTILLPFFDRVMKSIPSSYLAPFCDALRFSIQNSSPYEQMPIIEWVIQKIETTLWSSNVKEATNKSVTSDGFAEQSKWVGIMCAILMELDNCGTESKIWYANTSLPGGGEDEISNDANSVLGECWSNITERLLPRMLGALGHPYQKCREQVAWCLFNISNSYAKMQHQSKHYSRALPEHILRNPAENILNSLTALAKMSDTTSKEHQLCLTTARFFVFYCLHYGDNKNEYADFIIPLIPLAFEALKSESDSNEAEIDSEVRMLQAQVIKGYRYSIAEISASCFVTYNNTDDITQILKSLDLVSHNNTWQVRHAAAHFLRSFHGCHKFLFTEKQTKKTTRIVSKLLADDRKEVSAAAMSALTGILASTSSYTVNIMVEKYVKKANNSVIKKKSIRKNLKGEDLEAEFKRATKQQISVYFLCASVLSQPYDTPRYVPKALKALSKHSYERSAPFTVREAVKLCCREFKRTHMTDNWDLHKQQFSQDELEALDDVVSTPHYYA